MIYTIRHTVNTEILTSNMYAKDFIDALEQSLETAKRPDIDIISISIPLNVPSKLNTEGHFSEHFAT